ncbi:MULTISPECIES: Rha family transcriptional regulator [unclassified Halomonas]|uniref:Rha family transcriptional regulator n=1 Tax=unclassified Halomonas TaxID=2609666 RepID=UPI0020768CB6|nr:MULTISPECIES: Rha family transcriptional regulator [unclassified Halomonas]
MQHIISESEYAHMVAADNGAAVTTSMKIAEYFGKRHKDVLRRIKTLRCSKEFAERNFALCFHINKLQNGKRTPVYKITRDGFFFLAFGFTGEKADVIKEAYINAFNWMADRLRSYDHRRNELTALYKAGQHSASLCGRGLSRWKQDKRDLEEQIEIVEQEGQLPIPFLDAPYSISEVA